MLIYSPTKSPQSLFIFIPNGTFQVGVFFHIAIYRCISINYNVVEKFIYFSIPTQIVKLVHEINSMHTDVGPLGNSPVLLLSPGKTPLTTTVAKFIDTSVCGGS